MDGHLSPGFVQNGWTFRPWICTRRDIGKSHNILFSPLLSIYSLVCLVVARTTTNAPSRFVCLLLGYSRLFCTFPAIFHFALSPRTTIYSCIFIHPIVMQMNRHCAVERFPTITIVMLMNPHCAVERFSNQFLTSPLLCKFTPLLCK